MNLSLGPVPARTLLVGYGKLGSALAERLQADGGEVVALRRSDGMLPEGVIGVRADLAEPLSLRLPEVDALVVTLPPSDAGYRTALTHLVAALPSVPARTLFVSSTGVFAEGPFDRAISEADDPRPGSARSEQLRDGERAAQELFDAVIVRPAGIYGPGREFLLRQVRERASVNRLRRTNRIHEHDLVRALDLLLRMPHPPRIVHAVDRAPAPLGEVVDEIARLLGLDPLAGDPSAAPGGTVLDGSLLHSLLTLDYPTYAEGYAAMIGDPDRDPDR